MTIRHFEGKYHTMLGVAPATIALDEDQQTYTSDAQLEPQHYDSYDYDAEAGLLRVWTAPTEHFRIADCRDVGAD
jgi:hypothetical protein